MYGRFDKNVFQLPVSVLVGGNGGIFALLNSLPQDYFYEIKYNLIIESLTEEYLKTKMIGDKIILGEGNFGKVRLALCLSNSISKPCDLICVKKSKKM